MQRAACTFTRPGLKIAGSIVSLTRRIPSNHARS